MIIIHAVIMKMTINCCEAAAADDDDDDDDNRY